MVEAETSIKQIEGVVREYIAFVEKCFYLRGVYLYGSYAHNREKPYSDIDLALVSKDFKYMDDEIAMKILFRIARHIDSRIEPVVFAPENLVNPPIGTLAWEVVHNGVKLY